MSDEKVPTPIDGYCVLHRVERGKTEGGLHVPTTAGESDRFYVVATSGVFFVAGVKHEHPARVGDEVLCTGDVMAPSFLPKDHGIANLSTCPAYYPKSSEVH